MLVSIPRVIPCLLLQDGGCVKTTAFDDPVYLGDPINIVKLFNDMEVDELGILDIAASRRRRGPAFELLKTIADSAFMPLSYGGGVTSVEQIRHILGIGYEKVIMGRQILETPSLIDEGARTAGSQSIVVSIDVKKTLRGRYRVRTLGGRHRTRWDPADLAREVERRGAGELLLTSIDRDGTMRGYDIDLIRSVSDAVTIPVIAAGGACGVDDFVAAIGEGGASAVAAGSLFVFHGRRKAVLVSFPDRRKLEQALAGIHDEQHPGDWRRT